MAETAKGNKDAFHRIVERHEQSVLNLAYRFTGDKDVSRDLAQDIFLKIYQSASRYRQEARFTTWLYRVAVNHCLNHLRDTAREGRRARPFQDSDSHPGPSDSTLKSRSQSPEELLLEREQAARIREAIQDLPARQRMAIVLLKYHGLRYAEIAHSMECSVGAVESLIVRAMDQLRHSLKDLYQEKGDPP